MKHIPSYLHTLRAATKEAHQSLEALTGGEQMIRGELDQTQYQRLLGSHFLYHQELARHFTRMEPSTQAILDWPACKRIPALQTDLKQLHVVLQASDFSQLDLRSPAFTMGLCYVSEGSCLGNQQLLRALQSQPTFVSWKADHFFQSCREGFGERWKTFLSLLHPYGESSYPDLEAGAVAGFDYFKQLWTELSVHTSSTL